ncbi:MAG: aspartate--tRNA ligase, partial [Planctomycetales bacterium]|nr:aspartate--tRNA ligase [Planctomycetales bacterium]NIM08386.1 aspartate--tRNA ligase [Planctomycetales bacterium]NIN07861.1 aspartate--tRNA ligase [Planctomycetales bacterium]NIN76992.1 aspartate--tRNA ligase [Planctomycetales bacterium]NIO34175.1 aspartate--tRNA ligase [Planctomycetales bacterium]
MLRTNTCGELGRQHIGQTVTLAGWVDTYRDHRGALFVDLRDRYGKTQVVFSSDSNPELQQRARQLRSEFVVAVTGKIAVRPEGTVNPKLATGEIELRAESLEVLNSSLSPPFTPGASDLPGEDLRLKHR